MGFLSANPVPIEAEGKQELSTEEFVDKNIHYFGNSIIFSGGCVQGMET